ncbi:hypothetical protein [Stutzerimonas stutzeri]|uniref:hypothetical protein n=1 Tax=Stutzerimonas stutzeri TaxID=316 RepID=UPI00265ADE52|nr:hypothetical protein [Stutzerimonas stutzeri]MCF6780928.1 hypothetical protein [Stutzerimonas stutzeri]MCF6803497.1 hypothetical protein [Stutzerimonas stutzeri]
MPTDKAQEEINKRADWVLVTLILAAEKGAEVGVTLTTAAGLVTGTIIGGAKYMEMQKAAFAEVPGGAGSVFEKIFDDWRSIYIEHSDSEDNRPLISFIHLRDARLITGTHVVPANQGLLWRGKLDSVIGFNLGVMSAS